MMMGAIGSEKFVVVLESCTQMTQKKKNAKVVLLVAS
jgi:hypothetical protein